MSKANHIFMPEDHMDKLYNSKNPLVRFVHVNRLDKIVKMIPSNNGLKILDAGCGEGHLIGKMHSENSKSSYYGIDIAPLAIQKTKERCPYAELRIGDLAETGYTSEFFDVVVCTEVLEHMYEYKDAITELKRVLKKNGCLIITFPNETLWTISRFLLRRKPIRVPDHVNSFNPYKIKALFRLEVMTEINLPFRLPFIASLGCLIKFKKHRVEK